MSKRKFTANIGGMSCVNCSNSIEKVVKKLDGVESVSVNFSTGVGTFVYDTEKIDTEKIEEKINKLGFKVLKEIKNNENDEKKLLISFIIAVIGTIFLHFFSHFFHHPSNTILYISFIIATIVQFVSGFRFYGHSYKSLKNRVFDMNVLVALGTSAAYFYSCFVIFFPELFSENIRFIYFDGASMIIAFVLLGRYLEAKAKNRATNYMQTLLNLTPKKANVILNDEQIVQKEIDELQIGDTILVKAGENIGVDGIVIKGNGNVDTSLMSGEFMPLYAKENVAVSSGYKLLDGFLHIKVQKNYENSNLAKIIELLSDANNKKMPIARVADKVSSIFVPAIILISLLTLFVWLFIGDTKMAIIASISVLIISCPCALGLATPIAIISGIGRGAKEGIFIKNPEVLEIISKIKYAVFDKTGTLTQGKIEINNTTIKDRYLLSLIASCEAKSEHPISYAITNYAKQNGINTSLHVENFRTIAGEGISGVCDSKNILVGTKELLEKNGIDISTTLLRKYDEKLSIGQSAIFAAVDKENVGLFSFSDTIKESAKDLILFLKEQNIKTIMLTGDKFLSAQKVADKINIDEVVAEMLPDKKYEKIKEFQKNGKVLFVGDGINDSISLKQADIGIAMNSGADIAKESGDIILTNNDLSSVKKSINLSKNTMKIIKQNLFWAFIYNIVGIPLAAGIFYPLTLTPAFAGAAMSISSIIVVLNSLRL
ncbi:MAG: cation-translocating P-type ATPase, partial [Campylobacteraceae bacterium]|nr:cation-translocating P-type ATPase [Campylobacteraceae bacterium]